MNFAGQRLGPRPGLRGREPARTTPPAGRSPCVDNLLLDPEDHFYGGGREVHAAGPRRALDPDLEPQSRTAPARSSPTRTSPAGRQPRVRSLRGRPHRRDVPPGQPVEPDLHVEAAGPELDYYVLAGTPKEILGVYTDLTGKPPVPPEWAFGLWASTCFVKFTEASVLEAERGGSGRRASPATSSTWTRSGSAPSCGATSSGTPSAAAGPEAAHGRAPPGRLPQLPLDQPLRLLPERALPGRRAGGYFLRRPDGSVYDALVWSQRTERGMGLCAIVDFTNPEAVRWYRGLLDAQLALGADSFKPDFAEEIPEDARFANGLTGAEMHNPYPLLYQRECFEATQAVHGTRAVAWSRSAAPGVQRYPGHWAGDSECTFLDMANTLRGGLASALSGLAYWSHDIGGFWGDPSPELYVRWAQLGFLSALSRYHGATPRDPWRFGEEALAIFREYARLRSQLVPYLVSHGWAGVRDRRPPHAADGHGVPGRPRRLRLRPPVLPRTGAARLAGRRAPTARSPRTCRPALDGLVERDGPPGSADPPAPGAAPGAAALPPREQPPRAGPRAEPRGRATGRPAHGGGVRDDGGDLRAPHRRRDGRPPRAGATAGEHLHDRQRRRRGRAGGRTGDSSGSLPTIVLRCATSRSRRPRWPTARPCLASIRRRSNGADRGWTVDGRTVVLKARARELRIE